MKWKDVQKLLRENGYTYEAKIVPSSLDFYRKKGFHPKTEAGPFRLLAIPNPNHDKNIEIIFADASDDPDFKDILFGGFDFEIFDRGEEQLSQEMLTEIQRILNGNTHIILASIAKMGLTWHVDGSYYDLPDAEMNDMEAFQKAVAKIKAPKPWWKKLSRKASVYEIFNWTSYEKIRK